METEAPAIYFAQDTATLLGWLSAVPYLLPPSTVSPAPFLHVTLPSYRVSCPHLSRGPKLPCHALRKDSQEAETEQTETPPILGLVPIPLGRVCEEREGTKPQGCPGAGQKECWGAVAVPRGLSPLCTPHDAPEAPSRKGVPTTLYNNASCCNNETPKYIVFLSHSCTSSQQLFLDCGWLSSNAVI